MTQRVITIKCQTGEAYYVVPYIFEELTVGELKQHVFRLLIDNMWVDPQNEETARVLDSYLQEWAETKRTKTAAKRLAAWREIYGGYIWKNS